MDTMDILIVLIQQLSVVLSESCIAQEIAWEEETVSTINVNVIQDTMVSIAVSILIGKAKLFN